MKPSHPTWEMMLEQAESEVADAAYLSHLASCPDCDRRHREILRLLEDLDATRFHKTPAEFIARGKAALIKELARRAEDSVPWAELLVELAKRVGRPLRESPALLIADSLQANLALRSGTAAPERTQVYETKEFTIALRIRETEAGKRSLRGQVTARTGQVLERGRVFIAPLQLVPESQVDSEGEFEFAKLPDEESELVLVLDETVIRIDLDS